jgi:hypothetical protein
VEGGDNFVVLPLVRNGPGADVISGADVLSSLPESRRRPHIDGRSEMGGTSGYWSHRQRGAQIVSNLTSAQRRLKVF